MALYVFDAYGTLFDVHSAVARHAEAVGPRAAALSALWRTKQLEYSWVHALMGRYVDFRTLTARALDHALAVHYDVDPAVRPALLDAYDRLNCYPEVPDVLEHLRAKGHRTAILSNGSPDMLNAAIDHAGIGHLLDMALSVDALKTFKTEPRIYQMVCDQFDEDASAIVFQSSNRWDIAGAKAFGFQCNWINRTHAPDEYPDLPPDRTLSDLRDLLAS